MAELGIAEKNQLSHRARAVEAAKVQLRQLLAAGV
jgi:inosine/xanthosine triphosphate pyrophosphatase family protein